MSNDDYLNMFISAKDIEGCSSKTLKYYKDIILKFIRHIEKPIKEITTDDTGSLYYKILGSTFELDEKFEQIRKKYEIIYKDLDIEKNNRNYTIMVMLLIVSLILNTFTIISYLFM